VKSAASAGLTTERAEITARVIRVVAAGEIGEVAVEQGAIDQTDLSFNIGDKVVHSSYGPGEIIQLEEKKLSGRNMLYYVVQVRDMTLWVPVEHKGPRSLRSLTSTRDFKKLFDILNGPSELLAEDRLERKAYISEMLRDGSLASVCRVIRDLYALAHRKKLNEYDAATLERARKFLLDEWNLSLSVSVNEARHQLDTLLESGRLSHPS
jgi:RNA polymerase-interacting CarD/CdnL/TRCF family regulator